MAQAKSIPIVSRARPVPIIHTLVRPFTAFARLQAASGLLLIFCTVIALIWSNSQWASSYTETFAIPLSVQVGGFSINKPLLLWINDGLMAVFFFVVGLEIKREIIAGELSSLRQASLPIAAAVGGMAFPALSYLSFNRDPVNAVGWGIPMATDIAFALGVLALLGDRVPLSLKIFLTAFAIVDDIGAVLVIAIFYTDQIAQGPLLLAGGIFAACVMANWLGVRRPLVYTILGVVLWVAFLKSGIHATIAGVLLALTIPTSARIDTPDFLYYGKRLLNIIEKSAPEATEKDARTDIILKQERESALYALEIACEKVQSPLQRLEHFLHPWVSFFIMPIFALANAGVELHSANALLQPVSYGIIVGLLVGKPVGVLLCSYLAVRLKISDKPHDLSWRQIFGAGLLGGIGFTMSLFITSLAFREGALIPTAKLAILFASVIAGTTGFFLLRGGSVGNASRIEPPQDSKPQIQNSSP